MSATLADHLRVLDVTTAANGAVVVFSARTIANRGLRARGEPHFGVEFTFDGGVAGSHRIWEPREDQRALHRARAHWTGYVLANNTPVRH